MNGEHIPYIFEFPFTVRVIKILHEYNFVKNGVVEDPLIKKKAVRTGGCAQNKRCTGSHEGHLSQN